MAEVTAAKMTETTWRQRQHLWQKGRLGYEIRSEFHGIPLLFQFWTYLTLEFSSDFFLRIVKCVPDNSEHVPAGLESSPAIESSNFMNWKTFLQYLSVAGGIKF